MTDGEASPEGRVSGESRRSTRVRLKVEIEARGLNEPLTCEAETFVVNLHGALILTAVALRVGMKILDSRPSYRQTRYSRGRVRRSRPTATLCNQAGET